MRSDEVMIRRPEGFNFGYNPITHIDDEAIGMNFGVLKLHSGECLSINSPLESAYLLMTGKITIELNGVEYVKQRYCYFSQHPIVLHCAPHQIASIKAETHCELMVIETQNEHSFESTVFDRDNNLESDARGKGLLDDSSYRLVKTVFDKRNRPESNLVLGEIITFPGHWSSTPSHTHPHPEIYHYRFSEPQGYGMGENGEHIQRIRHNDTMLITDEAVHAHASAPGYCLYTLWFIRHLPGYPYIVPDFQPAHAWAKDIEANKRVWQLTEY